MPAVLGHPYRHEQFDRFIPLQVSKKLKLKTISSSNKESSLENKLYQERLGLALDINPLQNAFTFQQSKSNNTKSSFSTTLQEIDPFYRIKTSGEYEPKREHKVELLTLSHYIEAPELRNDYYSNLLCWSPLTNMLAIALQNEVYLWSSMRQEILPDLPYEDSKITALAYNNVNGVLAITRKDGSMSLVHDTTLDILGTFIHHENSICHVAWIPNSVKDIFAGDEMGRILHLYVSEIPETELSSQYPLKIEWRKTIHYHTQQICGRYPN